MTDNKLSTKNSIILQKLILACLTLFIALILPAFIVQKFEILNSNPVYQHLLISILIGLMAILGVWLLRSKFDKGVPVSIGLANPSKAIYHLLLGFGLISIPLVLTLFFSQLFGWATFSLNISNGILTTIATGIISTFFTDALSEELIFRGYIYSNLNERFKVWPSSLITLVVFVITPIIVINVQSILEIHGAVTLTGNYIITLIFFGAFMQYLRVAFKTIWVGIGFHLIFVQMNKLMGTTNDKLIQFPETANQQPIQITLIILILLVFLALFLYPIIKKRKASIE